MPLDYLSELKESCAIAKSRSLTVTRATKITEWKPALRRKERGLPLFLVCKTIPAQYGFEKYGNII